MPNRAARRAARRSYAARQCRATIAANAPRLTRLVRPLPPAVATDRAARARARYRAGRYLAKLQRRRKLALGARRALRFLGLAAPLHFMGGALVGLALVLWLLAAPDAPAAHVPPLLAFIGCTGVVAGLGVAGLVRRDARRRQAERAERAWRHARSYREARARQAERAAIWAAARKA